MDWIICCWYKNNTSLICTCFRHYIPSALHKCLLEFYCILSLITHLGLRIGHTRMCSTNYWKWTWKRMTELITKRFKAPLFSPFFAINLLALRLRMKCRISKLYDHKRNLQDVLVILLYVLCSDHILIILWSHLFYIVSHSMYSPIYCL